MHQNGMGRSSGRGRPNYSGSGPLMTEHLQVKNLDLELELLKHKRELVQREQEKLTMEREMNRKRQYENSEHNVSNTFGNIWQASSSKRANAPQQPHPWIDATHNSFGPNMSKSTSSHYIPPLLGNNMHQTLIPPPVQPIVHPILNNNVVQRYVRSVNARKGFRNTHGIKKIRKDLPNKLNTYPVEERKNLVSKATESQLAKTKNNLSPGDLNSMILREDGIPNNQVIGRLELALGSIVKDICQKHQNETFQTLVSNPKHRRTMKQVIRERIRAIMLNKPVGSMADIVKIYRGKFPLDTDRDIVELVVNSADPNFVNVTKTESPEEFFKKNITSLLKNKVQEMASNLLKMYNDIGYLKSLAYVKPATGKKKPNTASESELIANNETTSKVLRALTGKYITTEETETLNKYYTELIEDILTKKLPEYLPQCKEQFLKIFDMDQRFKTIITIATKRATSEIKKNGTITDKEETHDKKTDEINEMEDDVVIINNVTEEVTVDDNDDVEKEVDPKNNESEETASKNCEIADDAVIILDDEIEANSGNVNNEMVTDAVTENNDIQNNTLLENMPGKEVIVEADTTKEIPEAMPLAIDAQESSIPKSLSTSSEQQSEATTPTVLIAKETKPAVNIIPTTPMAERTELSILSSTSKTPVTSSPSAKELPYYVKLIGRPTLPNRAVICEFLNNYRPTSIKKHKSINNLLVVGFINQEDYSRILKANETVIGDITIIIKASEKVNAGKANESLNDSKQDISDNVEKEPTKDEVKIDHEAKEGNEICNEATDSDNVNKSDEGSDLIGKELDEQITNLLSTIKEGEVDTPKSDTPSSLETIKETEEDTMTAKTVESEKADKVPIKANVKESGRSTPVRSSRLGNVTPSTIRTRRSSRLMQE